MPLMPTRARNALATSIDPHTWARAIIAAAATLLIAGPALAFNPPPFPRIAILDINTGTAPYYSDTTEQGNLARATVTLLGDYPGFAPSGETMFDVIQAIKGINPNELIFTYVEEDDVDSSRAT